MEPSKYKDRVAKVGVTEFQVFFPKGTIIFLAEALSVLLNI